VKGRAIGRCVTHLDFPAHRTDATARPAAIAHLATLGTRLRAFAPACVLLDGGDSWQGFGELAYGPGPDMIGAQKRLGRRPDDRARSSPPA